MADYLLITRVDGSSSSRWQRRFPDEPAIDRAIVRARKRGANCFWVYGPFDDKTGDRPLLRQWNEGAE